MRWRGRAAPTPRSWPTVTGRASMCGAAGWLMPCSGRGDWARRRDPRATRSPCPLEAAAMRVLPVRFTVLRMMAAVAGVAVDASALRHAELATSLLILAASTFAVRSLFAGPVGRRSRRWAIPYLVTLACLYLPLVWVVWYHPWEGPRWAGV